MQMQIQDNYNPLHNSAQNSPAQMRRDPLRKFDEALTSMKKETHKLEQQRLDRKKKSVELID